MNFNHHILTSMKEKKNLFELDDFEQITQTKHY